MLTGAEVLLLDESLRSQQTATAARIRNSGKRMRKMIDDLLDFTRTRLGTGMPMSKSTHDLTYVLQNVIEELKAFHPDAKVDWSITGDLSINCDAARIEQMLSNLIANAIVHGGELLPITVTAQGNESDLIVKIQNHGDHISPAEQDVIFDPLRRAAIQVKEHGTQGVRGLGLGLYIVREIVDAHGGVIRVESSKKEGTTFTVRLPRHGNGNAGAPGSGS
jgi:signal transduction histidine kinase